MPLSTANLIRPDDEDGDVVAFLLFEPLFL